MSIGTPFLQRLDALLSRDAVLEHGLLNAASDEIEHLRSELAAARNAALEEAAKVAETRTKDAEHGTWQAQEGLIIAAAIRELKHG